MPSGHENFHKDTVVVTLWMFPGLSVRRSVAWQLSYAISLIGCQSKPRVTTVWLISCYSGKDLCTEGEIQLLLYSTRATLPTLPIDGCYKGLTLHHPNRVTVAILVTNAIVRITSYFLQGLSHSDDSHMRATAPCFVCVFAHARPTMF